MSTGYDSTTMAEAAFYRAFRELDIDRMRAVWLTSPAVYCIHPSGQLFRGYESILASWSSIFQVAERPPIQYSMISQTMLEGIAVHLVLERIGPAASVTENPSVVLATNIYQLTEGGWRMFGHHAIQARSMSADSTSKQQLH